MDTPMPMIVQMIGRISSTNLKTESPQRTNFYAIIVSLSRSPPQGPAQTAGTWHKDTIRLVPR